MVPPPTNTTTTFEGQTPRGVAPTVFERWFQLELRLEGGYVNHGSDPGGETKYGISKRAYPDLDIRALTPDLVRPIYRRDYWERAGCQNLRRDLAIVHGDAAVNHGVGRARKFLLETNNSATYLALRESFYRRLAERRPPLAVFLKGWMNRLEAVRKEIASA